MLESFKIGLKERDRRNNGRKKNNNNRKRGRKNDPVPAHIRAKLEEIGTLDTPEAIEKYING